MKRSGMLVGNFVLIPKRGTKRVRFKHFSTPKSTKTGSIWNRKRAFCNKGFTFFAKVLTSLALERLSGTMSTPKCCCLMSGTLWGTSNRGFDP